MAGFTENRELLILGLAVIATMLADWILLRRRFMPLDQLPGFVRTLAPFLPSYHYAQLAWSALGAGRESLGESLLWLACYTVLFLTLAVRAYRREERAKFA